MNTSKNENCFGYLTITNDENTNKQKLDLIRKSGVKDENIIREYLAEPPKARIKIELAKSRLNKGKTLVLYDIHDLGNTYNSIYYELKSIFQTNADLIIISDEEILNTNLNIPKMNWYTCLKIVQLLKNHEKNELIRKQNDGRNKTVKKLGRRKFQNTKEFLEYCIKWKNKEITIPDILTHFNIKRATFYKYLNENKDKIGDNNGK